MICVTSLDMKKVIQHRRTFVTLPNSALAVLSQNQAWPQKQDIEGEGRLNDKEDEWPRHN